MVTLKTEAQLKDTAEIYVFPVELSEEQIAMQDALIVVYNNIVAGMIDYLHSPTPLQAILRDQRQAFDDNYDLGDKQEAVFDAAYEMYKVTVNVLLDGTDQVNTRFIKLVEG